MAISGFGNTNNLRIAKPLANVVKQQVEAPKEELAKVEADKVDLQAPKKSLGQVKFDQVDSLLIGKGIKINKPGQPQEPEEPSMKPQAHLGTIHDNLKEGVGVDDVLNIWGAREGDTFKHKGDVYIIRSVNKREDGKVEYDIRKLND